MASLQNELMVVVGGNFALWLGIFGMDINTQKV